MTSYKWTTNSPSSFTISCFFLPAGLTNWYLDPPLRDFVRNRIWVNTWRPRLSLLRQLIWHAPQLKRKCANLQSDPGEGRSQEPAFGPFTNRIHHQSWIETHLEQERGLTKHRLHKINASRLLLVQVSLRGASDLNYQECFRKQQNSSCSLSQTHNSHQQHF